MIDTDELVRFIRGQLDREERTALAASPGPWRYNPDKHHHTPGTCRFEEAVFAGPAGKDAATVALTGETDDPQSMRDAEHVALQDPKATLDRVKAQRRIVERAVSMGEYRPAHVRAMDMMTGAAGALDAVLMMLARQWPDAEGFREEWGQ